jgi:hypothetical protein
MLGPTSEVMVSRFPLAAAVLATVVAFGVAGCDSGGSSRADKPHRSTTTTSTEAPTTTTVPADATSTTQPGGGGTTTTTAVPAGTCGPQTSAILAAIGDGPSGLKENAGKYTVQHCRLAPSSPIYAAANIVPNPGVQLDGATVVLERVGALWNVDSVGTSQVGCTFPAQVISELGLSC